MRFLSALLLLIASLCAQQQEYSDEPEVQQKVLYLSYVSVPERVFKNEIFPLTVKTLSTIDRFNDIVYTFADGKGLRVLTEKPERVIEGRYYIDTFYFQATSDWLQTPDITAALLYSQFRTSNPTTLKGKSIDVITLNPSADFANVLAKELEIINYKTTHYDRKHNIAVFSIRATRCNIESFHLKNIAKQGVESIDASHGISTMTYFAVIPKKLDSLVFSYFNLESETFQPVLIPIIIDDDTVSTQSDLTPIDHKHTFIKIIAAGTIATVSLIMLLIRRKLVYALFVLLPGLYIAFAAVPIQHACIKEGSAIYLLPMDRGTVFETTAYRYSLEVQGNIKGHTKVKLQNDKIGWVKNEDLCTP